MADRLTDRELAEVEEWAGGGLADDHEWPMDEVYALIAEVREHRAARTLTDAERSDVAELRDDAEVHDDDGLRAILAIIDRITQETP